MHNDTFHGRPQTQKSKVLLLWIQSHFNFHWKLIDYRIYFEKSECLTVLAVSFSLIPFQEQELVYLVAPAVFSSLPLFTFFAYDKYIICHWKIFFISIKGHAILVVKRRLRGEFLYNLLESNSSLNSSSRAALMQLKSLRRNRRKGNLLRLWFPMETDTDDSFSSAACSIHARDRPISKIDIDIAYLKIKKDRFFHFLQLSLEASVTGKAECAES